VTYGLNPTGFLRKTEDELFTEIADEARSTVSPDLDVTPDSVAGQIVGIVASKHAESWEVLQGIYGSFGPGASGAALDRLAALTGTVRILNETDAQLRLRRVQEQAGAGKTTEGALRAALSRLSGVTTLRVTSNRTMATVNTREPKSVEALLLGGTDAQIAATIWANLAAGIATTGTTTIAINDEEGNPQSVKFSRPDAMNVHARISVQVDAATYAGDVVLKQTIHDFTSGALVLETTSGAVITGVVPIEGVIYRASISAAAMTVPGVRNVVSVLFADDGMVWQNVDYGITLRRYLGAPGGLRGLQLDHIQVSSV